MPKTSTKPAFLIVSRRTTPAWMLRRYDEPRQADHTEILNNRWRQTRRPYLRVVK
jgi:hypothetical protein